MTDAETIAVYTARADDYARCFESDAPGKHLLSVLDQLPKPEPP